VVMAGPEGASAFFAPIACAMVGTFIGGNPESLLCKSRLDMQETYNYECDILLFLGLLGF
jgi:hypothetical protein